MKKYRFLIIAVVLMISFFMGVKKVRALPTCDFEANYGKLETRTQKQVNSFDDTAFGIESYHMNNLVANTAGGWSTDPKKFYYVFAWQQGHIKNAKFTVYSDNDTGKYEGEAECEYFVDVEKKCQEEEGQSECQTFKFIFEFSKKHVLNIKVEGTYYDANQNEQKFNSERFLVYKETDGSGKHHTTDPNKPITTAENKHIDSGDEKTSGTGKAGTLAGETKNIEYVTDTSGNILFQKNKDSCTTVKSFVREYWSYVMVFVPILLIILMSIDFFKAMASNDADAIKKTVNNTVKRVIAAVILLALPALLSMIFDLFGIEEVCI